ncbi:MAG: TetR family transcriptional regulator [Pseudomonadota bacterium]
MGAAIYEFSDKGYDGVTVRDIEVRADVQRGLLKYHFEDKANLWKEAITSIFGELLEFRRARLEMAQDLPANERLAFRIRSFVRFSAQHPELNRLMIQEGKTDSWRMTFMVETFIRHSAAELRELVDAELVISDQDFFHWYYMFIGAGALAFNVAPEAKQLFGVDVSDEDVITRHAHLTANVLLSMAVSKTKPPNNNT